MAVTILLFAQLAKMTGVDRLTLELHPGATVADALKQLVTLHPSLSDVNDRVATAVNMTYVERTFPLDNGDELALIPPVCGG